MTQGYGTLGPQVPKKVQARLSVSQSCVFRNIHEVKKKLYVFLRVARQQRRLYHGDVQDRP